MESAKALFKARSTVQQALGVEDTEAENRAILADPIQGLDVAAKRGEVLTSWGTSTNLDTAVEAAGVTGDLAAKARRTDGPTPEQ